MLVIILIIKEWREILKIYVELLKDKRRKKLVRNFRKLMKIIIYFF